ncbi:unnamed protein product [Darwinula stevensoni]|uniref:Uncharacterized protein n=1 Tax=Darwinula stevensoni TaxID=69355 RepID=A0A7R9FS61_9CRUS|nr:unnamed protein product [Darwinula stevensoni]CAG0902673.1 unnamed protein product [Darwinula stevensoni]
MTEELRDPYKSLPRAIYISLPVVTFIYVLANVAYLAVLPPPEMRASEAIAVGILSLMMLFTTDIYRLIEYSSFVESFFITLSILSLLYLRWKRPDLQRPIKVNLLIPLIFLSICTFLVVMPLKERPFEVLMAIAISAAGVPIYFIFVYMKKRPQCLDNLSYGFTCLMQKVFFAAEGQKAD